MDLGATVCTRSNPACKECPLESGCRACHAGMQQAFPSPRPKRDLPVRSVQMLLLLNSQQEVYLQKRPATGIWGGLWGFPEFQTVSTMTDWCDQRGIIADADAWPELRHTFSHFHLDITPQFVRLQNPQFSVMEDDRGVWYNTRESGALGFAAPVQRLLAQLKDMN